jgi:hypothetical protein
MVGYSPQNQTILQGSVQRSMPRQFDFGAKVGVWRLPDFLKKFPDFWILSVWTPAFTTSEPT